MIGNIYLQGKMISKKDICGFQLTLLVKSLMVDKRSRIQSPPTPKTDWCLGLMKKSYHQKWTP